MTFLERLKYFDIILGSQSPRRRELLQAADIPFRVMHRSIPEHFPEELPPHEVVLQLCLEKSEAFLPELKDPRVVVITADTIVVSQGGILNKAVSEAEAFSMLSALSGKWHQVLTGVCIRKLDAVRLFYETTRVQFRELSSEEINYYIRNYKPFDKAGAYGIQEWIGYVGISRIEGSWANVVGLPVERVYRELREMVGK